MKQKVAIKKKGSTLQRVSWDVVERIQKILDSGSVYRSKAHFIDDACNKLASELEHRRSTK